MKTLAIELRKEKRTGVIPVLLAVGELRGLRAVLVVMPGREGRIDEHMIPVKLQQAVAETPEKHGLAKQFTRLIVSSPQTRLQSSAMRTPWSSSIWASGLGW